MSPELALFESDSSVIYCLDSEFRISYCNAAWDRFATENDGLQLRRPAPVGLCPDDYLPSPLHEFYLMAFEPVLQTAHPWEHLYECSSPGMLRRFHMRVSPVPGLPNSLAVVNSQLTEEPMRRTVFDAAADARYRRGNGLVTMCANCRRTRRASEDEWDCVPKYVEQMPSATTHGLCPPCLAIYFPEALS